MKMFVPTDDDLCQMLAKVIMRTCGFDAARSMECAKMSLRVRQRRKEAEQDAKERAARRIWMKMAEQ